MRWSKLRQLVEQRFAPCLAGRVRVMATRYRQAHDQDGRWAIVLDGLEIGYDTISTRSEEYTLPDSIVERDGVSWSEAQRRAISEMKDHGRHTMEGFMSSLDAYLSASIDDCLVSDDAVIRALGFLDARLGKRRLAALDVSRVKTDLEVRCMQLRLEAEGLVAPRLPN